MNRWPRLAGSLVVSVLMASCEWMCSDAEEHVARSPDGRYVARLLLRNCHATVPYATVLRVTDSRAFILANREWVVAACEGPFRLAWVGRSRLQVEYPERAAWAEERLRMTRQAWGDLEIEVRPVVWPKPPLSGGGGRRARISSGRGRVLRGAVRVNPVFH
jgi:hypothetical protein